MPIPVEAYTAGGAISGVVARAGRLRDWLETLATVTVEHCRYAAQDTTAGPAHEETFEIDDLLVVPIADDPSAPVHANWHRVRMEIGPYELDAELPTLPGFDPGRSLTRPSGTFVLVRDLRIRLLGRPESEAAAHHFALVNRYAVDRIEADIMLGFFFPGAELGVVGQAGSAPASGTLGGFATAG